MREQWGSQTGFILAAIGSAVGLGNIWRFAYVAGENGGGAFLLVYLVIVLTLGSAAGLTASRPSSASRPLRPGAGSDGSAWRARR